MDVPRRFRVRRSPSGVCWQVDAICADFLDRTVHLPLGSFPTWPAAIQFFLDSNAPLREPEEVTS